MRYVKLIFVNGFVVRKYWKYFWRNIWSRWAVCPRG